VISVLFLASLEGRLAEWRLYCDSHLLALKKRHLLPPKTKHFIRLIILLMQLRENQLLHVWPCCVNTHLSVLTQELNICSQMQLVASSDQALHNAAKVSPRQRKEQTTASPKSASPSVPPDFRVHVGMGRVWLQREITSFAGTGCLEIIIWSRQNSKKQQGNCSVRHLTM